MTHSNDREFRSGRELLEHYAPEHVCNDATLDDESTDSMNFETLPGALLERLRAKLKQVTLKTS